MLFDNEIDEAFRLLIRQWNIAERRIKKAELATANNVVASAIFELRYAGRKMVDALDLLLDGAWQSDVDLRARILRDLADATEDCVKAKHDAIDASLVFITAWIERTENAVGLSGLVAFFPDYIKIIGTISDVQDRIADSRGDRNGLRDKTYDEIEGKEYDEILKLYAIMKSSEDRIRAQVQHEDQLKQRAARETAEAHKSARRGTTAGIIAALTGILALCVAIAAIVVQVLTTK